MNKITDSPTVVAASTEANLPAATQSSIWPRIMSLLLLVWRDRRFHFRFFAYGALGAIILALAVPKRYETTTRIMPPDLRGGLSPSLTALSAPPTGAGGMNGFANSLFGFQSSSALYVGILSSQTVENHLIDYFDLRAHYGVGSRQDARRILERRTHIEEDRKNGIVSITVRDGDPLLATAIGNAYARKLNQLVVQLSTSEARRERIFLESRLQTAKADLDVARRKLSQFSSKNTLLDIQEQERATVEATVRLKSELIVAQAELTGLEQVYTADNFRVRTARGRVEKLQQELGKIAGNHPQGSGVADLPFPSLRQLPMLGIPYAELYRQTKLSETLYEILIREYELASIQEAKELPSVRVLDVATIPEKSYFPPRGLIVFCGTLLSCGLGLSWKIFGQFWRQDSHGDSFKTFVLDLQQMVRARYGRPPAAGEDPSGATEFPKPPVLPTPNSSVTGWKSHASD